MTPLIPDNDVDQKAFNRRVRDAVNAHSKRLTQQGATAVRPVAPVKGQFYYDETLGVPIWFNGTVWKNAAGTTV